MRGLIPSNGLSVFWPIAPVPATMFATTRESRRPHRLGIAGSTQGRFPDPPPAYQIRGPNSTKKTGRFARSFGPIGHGGQIPAPRNLDARAVEPDLHATVAPANDREPTTRTRLENAMAKKYGKAAQKSVERAMHKRKKGTLKSGRSKKKVKSRKQAIAIGLSEARKKGAKVPAKKKGTKKGTKKSK